MFNKNSNILAHTFAGIEVTDKYEFNQEFEGDIDDLSFSIQVGIEMHPENNAHKIGVLLKYELKSPTGIVNVFGVKNRFIVPDQPQFLVKENEKYILKEDITNQLVEISFHHMRALHALEMQKEARPYFIPVVSKSLLRRPR